jgi:hypothetical protein
LSGLPSLLLMATRARARKPGDADRPRKLREKALRTLEEICDRKLDDKLLSSAVSAASRILSHVEWLQEHSLEGSIIRALGGPEKAWLFLAKHREALIATLEGHSSTALLSLSPSEDGGIEASSVTPAPAHGESTQGLSQKSIP